MRWWPTLSAALVTLISWWVLRDSYSGVVAWGLCAGAATFVVVRILLGVHDRVMPVPRSREADRQEQLVRSAEQPRYHRERALERLVALRRAEALPLLDTLFDEDPVLRPAVVLAWARLKHAEAVPRMAELIEGSDERLGESIADALAHFDSPESEAALLACLEHPEGDVVWEAVDSLRRVGRERARQALERLLEATKGQAA